MTEATDFTRGVQEMKSFSVGKALNRFPQKLYPISHRYIEIIFVHVALRVCRITSAALFRIKHFLCLTGSLLLSSTSLSNVLASLTVNCSVLLLSVTLASSQTLAPRRLYHKGQKEEKLCVCAVCGWVGRGF